MVPYDREVLGFYVFGSAREIGFKFLHSKSLVLVSTAVFIYFFRLKVLGIHELKRRFTDL